jgi:hypothetical protein
MSNLVELLCAAHLDRSKREAVVTTVDGEHWAFCPGGEAEGHDWQRIEAVAVESLRTRPPHRLQELLAEATR